ncbi:hypothetical protein [Actinotalea sp. K2]|uniref:hypothetical protein n=1 Tax=Actinotalea sp. K2 TaxID=2939438 RepID=UPI00201755F1|nr:hypothetical protein [Actinotalea sp. K2]MCL3862283.1 hypothetical protein [Actinotalea sp. K2]
MKTVKRVLLVAMVTAAIGLPVGAALAATDDPPAPGTGWSWSGPPSWAPQECLEVFDSPEMEQWREEHRAERQEERAERRDLRPELRGERFGDRVGTGHMGGRMWDRADS